MEREELQKALWERNEKDYNELIKKFTTVKGAIHCAYEIAHYNEVYDFINNALDIDVIEKLEKHITILLNTDLNIIDIVWEDWCDYTHSERYNFFNWEDLFDIVKCAWEQKLFELFLDKWKEEHKEEAYETMEPPCFDEWWNNEAEELAGE